MSESTTSENTEHKTIEYSVNNYGPLNAAISNLVQRIQLATRIRSLEQYWQRAKVFVFVLIGICVAILILAIAFRIYSGAQSPLPFVGTKSNIASEKLIVRVPDERKSKVIEKPIIIEKPIYTPIKVPVKTGVVTNFTIFQTKRLSLSSGQFQVVTGWNYDSSEHSLPNFQYCYVLELDPNVDPRNTKRLDLAVKKTSSQPIFYNYYDIQNRIIEISEQDYGVAQKSCQFTEVGRKEAQPVPPPPPPPGAKQNGSGSGFVVHPEGLLVTNEHVVSDCRKITARNGSNFFAAQVSARNKDLDLALLKISSEEALPFVRFATSIRSGDDVVALGYPLSRALGDEVKITTGNISAMVGLEGNPNSLQFTAPIQPGSSGGPLLDRSGNLVGVNASGLRDRSVENINFAIKSTLLQKYLGDLKIEFFTSELSAEISTADIAETAKNFTYQIFLSKPIAMICIPFANRSSFVLWNLGGRPNFKPNNLARWMLASAVLLIPTDAVAHGGGLDLYGCHHNRKAGGYHCHQGPNAGQQYQSKLQMLQPQADQLSGQARVTDGDTIRIGSTRIRLHGIDAPESKQRCTADGQEWQCGSEATEALRSMINGKDVVCSQRDKDRYGRIVAVCRVGATDINAWMVLSGWAVAYRRYSLDYVKDEGGQEKQERIMARPVYDAVGVAAALVSLNGFSYGVTGSV